MVKIEPLEDKLGFREWRHRYGEGVGLTQYKMKEDRAAYKKYFWGETSPFTPEVTKLTGDIWETMTPAERDNLRVKALAASSFSDPNSLNVSKFWDEYWGEEKRALIREYKKEQSAIPKNQVTSKVTKLERNLMGLTEKEIVELVNPVKVKLARDLGLYYGRTDTAASIRAIDYELLKARREALTKRGYVLPRHKTPRITPKTPKLRR